MATARSRRLTRGVIILERAHAGRDGGASTGEAVGGRDMPRTIALASLLYRTSTFFSLLALGFAQVERRVVRRPGDSARVEKPARLRAHAHALRLEQVSE